ncbi:hypothetical protein [Otoolea muris]|uniref:hypothetical protein n=1 Tax=Otoolea muris TaxID=2941515 RepID=UPI00203DFA75|nr:hypothetical protein [Otoolea muris]
MANILQVTTPSINNRNIIDSQGVKNEAGGPHVQNPVDPTRVVRADGQTNGQAGTATGEGAFGIIDYESNYGAFVQKLEDALGLPGLLKQLMFDDLASLVTGEKAEVGNLAEQLFSSIQTDSPEELMQLLKEQQAAQVKFSGPLFDGLRNLLARNAPEGVKDSVTAFLKAFNDFSSGEHQLKQMHSLTGDISRLMLSSFREDFNQLVQEMDWEAQNGNTEANTEVINSRLIPFLSNYVSRTHDYGPIRNAAMMFIFHAVKYENGGHDRLMQLFNRMIGNKDFQQMYKGDAEEDLQETVSALGRQTFGRSFADAFSTLLMKGANGQAGLENIQQFYDIFNGMLLNESVYLPLMHILLPFRFQEKEVMSEVWIDPDAKKDSEDEARKIKLLLKFDVQNLGKFDMVMALQNRKIDMQLYVPERLSGEKEDIQENIAGILKKNGLGLNRILVKKKEKEIGLKEAFPEFRQKERGINVRI